MSINFATLQGLTIPEGVVTQITDAAGRVIWAVQNNKPIVLGVEKKSFSSYEGETTYSSDCVLLDIYPKTANSTVNVTYGGLTKTLTFTGTNAQKVYFGTFNGASDSVTTPASGTLTIEGDYDNFAVGTYYIDSKNKTNYCSCITAVTSWGNVTKIPNYAFAMCKNLALLEIPEGVTSIGSHAFSMGQGLDSGAKMYDETITLPSTIQSIGGYVWAYYTTKSDGDQYGWYIKSLVLRATTPPSLGKVDMIGSLKSIVVPKGCGDAYKVAEGWNGYSSYIVEAE